MLVAFIDVLAAFSDVLAAFIDVLSRLDRLRLCLPSNKRPS